MLTAARVPRARGDRTVWVDFNSLIVTRGRSEAQLTLIRRVPSGFYVVPGDNRPAIFMDEDGAYEEALGAGATPEDFAAAFPQRDLSFKQTAAGSMELYHGTQIEHLDSILKRGLLHPFLTDSMSAALHWARAYSNSSTDMAVLKIEVDTSRLVPDTNDAQEFWPRIFGPDVEWSDIRSELYGGGEEMLRLVHEKGIDWEDSIGTDTGELSVIYIGRIEPSQIEVVYRADAGTEEPEPDIELEAGDVINLDDHRPKPEPAPEPERPDADEVTDSIMDLAKFMWAPLEVVLEAERLPMPRDLWGRVEFRSLGPGRSHDPNALSWRADAVIVDGKNVGRVLHTYQKDGKLSPSTWFFPWPNSGYAEATHQWGFDVGWLVDQYNEIHPDQPIRRIKAVSQTTGTIDDLRDYLSMSEPDMGRELAFLDPDWFTGWYGDDPNVDPTTLRQLTRRLRNYDATAIDDATAEQFLEDISEDLQNTGDARVPSFIYWGLRGEYTGGLLVMFSSNPLARIDRLPGAADYRFLGSSAQLAANVQTSSPGFQFALDPTMVGADVDGHAVIFSVSRGLYVHSMLEDLDYVVFSTADIQSAMFPAIHGPNGWSIYNAQTGQYVDSGPDLYTIFNQGSAPPGSQGPSIFAMRRTADKVSRLNQLRKRPENQDESSQKILAWLERSLPERAEKLVPWLFKEAKKGNIPWEYGAGLYDLQGNVTRWPDVFTHFADWLEAKRPDFMRMSWDQARGAIKEWDDELAGEDQYKEHIVSFDFGNGWTMQWVGTKDAALEGELMGHCIGDYCNDIAAGHSFNYSLRDPQNRPHATVELLTPPDDNANTVAVVQVQGKQNKEPIPQYQEMIRQWLASYSKPVVWANDNAEISVNELLEGEVAGRPEPPYGISKPLTPSGWPWILEHALERANRPYYGPTYVSDWSTFAQAAVESAEHLGSYLELQTAWKTKVRAQAYELLDRDLDRVDYGVSYDLGNHYSDPAPSRDDYEDEGEYDEAYQEWQEAEEQARFRYEDEAQAEMRNSHPLAPFIDTLNEWLDPAAPEAEPAAATPTPNVVQAMQHLTAAFELLGTITFWPDTPTRTGPLGIQDASSTFIQDLWQSYPTVRINPMWSGVDMSSTHYDAPTGTFNLYPADGVDMATIQPALEAVAEQWKTKGWGLTYRADQSQMTQAPVFRVTITENPTTYVEQTPSLNVGNVAARALLSVLGLGNPPDPSAELGFEGNELAGSIAVPDLARALLRVRNTTGALDKGLMPDEDTSRPTDLKPFTDVGFEWDEQWGDSWGVYWRSELGSIGVTRSDQQGRYSVWGTDLGARDTFSYSQLDAKTTVSTVAEWMQKFGGDTSRLGPELVRAMVRAVNTPAPPGPRVISQGIDAARLERYLSVLEDMVKWCQKNGVKEITWA